MLDSAIDCVKQPNTGVLFDEGLLSLKVNGIKHHLNSVEEVDVLVQLDRRAHV